MSQIREKWNQSTLEEKRRMIAALETFLFGDDEEPDWLDDPEMVDFYLRWQGYDPDQVVARIRATVDRAIEEREKVMNRETHITEKL